MLETLNYFLILFFFKIAIGAILLLTGWDSLSITNNSITNITIIMGLSFVPAAFAKPLFNKFSHIAISAFLTITLALSALTIIIEHYLFSVNIILGFIAHFILWILIFLSEVGCEKWYIQLAKKISQASTRKLSGISTSIAQLGIIFGPIIILLTHHKSNTLSYWLIFFCFLLGSLMSLTYYSFTKNETDHGIVSVISNKKIIHENIYVLAFALIWPTVTIFNLTIPVLAKTQFSSISIAANLEMLFAASIAIAGLTYHFIAKNFELHIRISSIICCLIVSSIITYYTNHNIQIILLSIAIIGLNFGYLRIELRTYLSQQFSTTDASNIIAKANSWSGVLVIAYAAMFYSLSQLKTSHEMTLLFPASFILFGAVLAYLLRVEDRRAKSI